MTYVTIYMPFLVPTLGVFDRRDRWVVEAPGERERERERRKKTEESHMQINYVGRPAPIKRASAARLWLFMVQASWTIKAVKCVPIYFVNSTRVHCSCSVQRKSSHTYVYCSSGMPGHDAALL
jgi:hypothetical protein